MLGLAHPDFLMQRLTAVQFAEWVEFYDLEPWGHEADEVRFGILCSLIAATTGTKLPPRGFHLRPAPEEEEDEDLDEKVKRIMGYSPPTKESG